MDWWKRWHPTRCCINWLILREYHTALLLSLLNSKNERNYDKKNILLATVKIAVTSPLYSKRV